LTLNRQPARVLVGTRVGYLNTVSTETATTQTVEFLEVGTELAVRPFVSQNGLIRLELRPQVSSFTLRQITDGGGSTITIPDEDTTEMTTNVMVRDGQTVVLGGLFTETTTASRRQVPLLGNIPMIGQAFRGNDDSTRRSEIIFLITPSIVNDTFLTETGDRGSDFVEHARYGARKGLLPWSRERRVGQILIDARRLADEGRTEKALAKVDQALRLQPNSPDARAIRTELTGEMRVAPTRAMIQSILHGELLDTNKKSVQSDLQFEPVVDVSPLSDIDWPEPAVDLGYEEVVNEQVAEVPEQVSEASDEVIEFQPEFRPGAGFEAGSESEFSESMETAFESGIDESSAETIYAEVVEDAQEFGSEMGFEELAVEQETAFDPYAFDPYSFDPAPFITEVLSDAQMATSLDESLWEEQCIEEVAPGIAVEQELTSIFGHLIISLPGGGALQLDWPLSASDWTSANSIESVEETDSEETQFTEVPTGDFE